MRCGCSRGEIARAEDVVGFDEVAVAESDDESVAFESVHESAIENTTAGADEDAVMGGSVMQDDHDIGTAEFSLNAAKKSKLPTPLSNEVTDEEL